MGDHPTEPLIKTLKFQEIGGSAMDSQLQDILKNIKELNTETLKYQKLGSASTGQIKQLQDQISESQKMLDTLDRMARTQGANTEALSSYRKELQGMTQDLSNVKTFQNPVSNWLGKKYGSGAGSLADQAVTAGKSFFSKTTKTFGGFDVMGDISKGLDSGTQLALSFGDLAKQVAPSANSRKWGLNLLTNLQGDGYDDKTLLDSATKFANATGPMDTNDFTSQLKSMEDFGRAHALDLSKVTDNVVTAYVNGFVGSTPKEIPVDKYMNLLENTTINGGMQGSESAVMDQMNQMFQTVAKTNVSGQNTDVVRMSKLLSQIDKSGQPGLITQASTFLSSLDNGLANPGNSDQGQNDLMNAIDPKHKLDTYQQQIVQSADMFTQLDELHGKTKFDLAFPALVKQYKGKDGVYGDEEAVRLGKELGINANTMKQYLPYLVDAKGNLQGDPTVTLQKLEQASKNGNLLNETDIDRNKMQSKQYAIDKTASDTLTVRSDQQYAEGQVINYTGSALVDAGVAGSAVQGAGQVLKTGKSMVKVGKKMFSKMKGGESTAGESAGESTATAAESTAAESTAAATAGETATTAAAATAGEGAVVAAGEVAADAGVVGGLEAAGLAADATGIGAPVGIALGLAGLAVGAWDYFKNKNAAPKPDTAKNAATTPDSGTTGNSCCDSSELPNGEDLAPIVVSTIAALVPYMSQIQSYFKSDSSNGSADTSSTTTKYVSTTQATKSDSQPSPSSPTSTSSQAKPSQSDKANAAPNQAQATDGSSYYASNLLPDPLKMNQSLFDSPLQSLLTTFDGTPGQFVQKMMPYAQMVSKSTNLPTDLLLAEWGKDSKWGTSDAAKDNFNFANLKPWQDAGPGRANAYAGYRSLNDFANGYIEYVQANKKQFLPLIQGANSGASSFQLAQYEGNTNYANDPQLLLSDLEKVQQAMKVTGSVSVTLKYPNGDSQQVKAPLKATFEGFPNGIFQPPWMRGG